MQLKIKFEDREIESEEEINTKNVSDDEVFVHGIRRDSQESNASTDTNVSNASKEPEETKSDVEELTEQFKIAVKVDENEKTDVESVTEQLKSKLIVSEDQDLQERQPTRNSAQYSQKRSLVYPYQQTRSVHHYSGGIVSQNDHLNINYGQLVEQPSRAASASPPQLVAPTVPVSVAQVEDLSALLTAPTDALAELSGTDIDNFFNFNDLSQDDTASYPSWDASSIFNNLPPGPESGNQATFVATDNSFSTRQSTPPHSDSPGSSPSYLSCDLFSPQSNFSSDVSQSVGSPGNSLYDQPSTSSLSFASNNSPPLIPSTVPNTSDEEDEQNQESTNELRNLIDTTMKDIKRSVWVSFNIQKVEDLISELRKLLYSSRLTDRKLVQIYSAIFLILQQNGPLRQFFLDQPNILYFVAFKNHPLLLKYIIETMKNLGLYPEDIVQSPTMLMRKVIEQNQDMSEILKVLLSLKTKYGLMMFDMNEVDQDGLTVIHRILLKISKTEDPELKNLAVNYLKICLENQPDFTRTSLYNRTYLHHAVALGCGAQVVDMILRYCASSNPSFDLVNERDIDGNCALRLAAGLTQGRKEVEAVLFRYNAFNIYEEVDQNLIDLNNLNDV